METSTDLHTSSTRLKSTGEEKSLMERDFVSLEYSHSNACNEGGGVRLFGVRLTDSMMMMRKTVSMGNLSCYNTVSPQVARLSTPEVSDSGEGLAADVPHGYVSDGLVLTSGSLRERKKGVPWTEDEHRMFLVGLQKLGKGDWRGISRNFVPSRTPTQVASHAQKYFLRQSNLNKRKRRSSLFDIISSNEVPASNGLEQTGKFVMELNSTSSNLISMHAAPTIPCEIVSPVIDSLGSADLTSISADLCLGRHPHERHQQQSQVQRWLHTFSTKEQVNASLSNSDCRQLLPPGSFTSERWLSEVKTMRPSVDVVSAFASSSMMSSSSSSSSLSSLCRIDEASELSANLMLSIGPPLPSELALKLEQPVSKHSATLAVAKNSSNTLTNAIRVV
eukprot:c20262_g2_i1 orf=408-1580(+)